MDYLLQNIRMKKVAFVIPACNEENYVGRCLESISLQDLSPLEIGIVVVENGSDDNTRRTVEDYVAPFDLILDVNSEKLGASKSRNKGAEIALREFSPQKIIFCDADNRVSSNLARLVASSSCVGGTPKVIYEPTKKLGLFDHLSIKYQEFTINAFACWWNNIVAIPFPAYTPLLFSDVDFVKFKLEKDGYVFRPDIEMGEELIFQKEMRKYGDTGYLGNACVITSTRRWEKQGTLKIFFSGIVGQFYKGQKQSVEGRL